MVEKERNEEEGRRKKRRRRKPRFGNFLFIYGIHVWNISFVWNFWICWLGNHHSSFFVYVWVRKTSLFNTCVFWLVQVSFVVGFELF